ncbi:MAG: hypothetical protein ACYYKD_09870 [Rhodospirillales bacterium]
MRMTALGAAAALTAALGLADAAFSPAAASMFATSESPYWQVGRLSPELSRACQKGEFGQRRRHLYNIGFIGPNGQSLTGIANTDWNLYDPRGLAEPRYTYHFYNQGYSNCKVYAWPQPNTNRAPNGP